jgi:hypothetical protein
MELLGGQFSGKQFSPFMEMVSKQFSIYGTGCNQQHTRQLIAKY